MKIRNFVSRRGTFNRFWKLAENIKWRNNYLFKNFIFHHPFLIIGSPRFFYLMSESGVWTTAGFWLACMSIYSSFSLNPLSEFCLLHIFFLLLRYAFSSDYDSLVEYRFIIHRSYGLYISALSPFICPSLYIYIYGFWEKSLFLPDILFDI